MSDGCPQLSHANVIPFDHAFNLAAALAELLVMIDAEARTSGRPLTMAAAVAMSDSRQALMAFHEWVEASP